MKAYNGFPGEYRESQYRKLKQAWDLGTVPRPSRCVACGSTSSSLNAHHEDYSKPFVYDELCCVCHLMVHCRFGNLDAWERYCRAVRTGYQPPATKQPQAMKAVRFLTTQPAALWPGTRDGAIRDTTVLDTYPLEPFIHPNAQPDQPELPM